MQKETFNPVPVPNNFLKANGLFTSPRETKIRFLQPAILSSFDTINKALSDLAWFASQTRKNSLRLEDLSLPPADHSTAREFTRAIFGDFDTFKDHPINGWQSEFLDRLKIKKLSPCIVKVLNLPAGEDDLSEYPQYAWLLKRRFQNNLWLGDVFLQLRYPPTLVFQSRHRKCVCYISKEDLQRISLNNH